MPNTASPIAAWVTVSMEKSSSAKVPRPSAGSAGISSLIASIGEMPVSGIDEWAVLPSSTMRMPREAQLTTPALSRTSPNGTPGRLCNEKAKSGAISPKRGSATTPAAPLPVSSAGWNISTTRPLAGLSRPN